MRTACRRPQRSLRKWPKCASSFSRLASKRSQGNAGCPKYPWPLGFPFVTLIIHSAFLVASGDPTNDGADARGVICDGAVAVDGAVIVGVGPREALLAQFPGARERAHAGVITPGLVNAHTHLQYTSYADLAELGEPFPVWIGEMMKRRATTTDTQWAESARLGAHAALKAGTTAAADIVTDAAALLPLARSGLRGISYVEALAA